MSEKPKPPLSPCGQTVLPADSIGGERRQFLRVLSSTVGAAVVAPALASMASQVSAADAKDKRTILITGATSGLGRRVAERLAGPETTILVHGRDRERAEEVLMAIQRAGGTGRFYRADLASLTEVSGLADAIIKDFGQLDVLVNNAGIYIGKADEGRQISKDGHELRFAVNYLAPFALTRRLLPLLTASRPARIVNVASSGQNAIDFNDVMLSRGYSAQRAYGQSKLALIMFTIDLAKELQGSGVTANSVHPANYMDTPMVRESGITPWSSVDEGAAAVLYLINSPDIEGQGLYFSGQRPSRANSQVYDEEARARLRTLSTQLTNS
ncbi:SDR family NAD(P)-dependent oxidoreductase [Xylophilus sp. GW821-FHT01B05]